MSHDYAVTFESIMASCIGSIHAYVRGSAVFDDLGKDGRLDH
jgi:hypothetical protein